MVDVDHLHLQEAEALQEALEVEEEEVEEPGDLPHVADTWVMTWVYLRLGVYIVRNCKPTPVCASVKFLRLHFLKIEHWLIYKRYNDLIRKAIQEQQK